MMLLLSVLPSWYDVLVCVVVSVTHEEALYKSKHRPFTTHDRPLSVVNFLNVDGGIPGKQLRQKALCRCALLPPLLSTARLHAMQWRQQKLLPQLPPLQEAK